MANTIKLRRSATSGATPTTTQLALGEVAINTYDGKVFIKKDDGTESIVEVGASGTPEITWTLTASGTSDYIFSGDGFPTSQNDPTLYLIRGQTYKFYNNTGAHPFRIQSTGATSGGGTQYNSGVTNQDAGNGDTLTFVVPMDAPDILYYQCTSHTSMFGTIYILTSYSDTDVDTHLNVSSASSGEILSWNGSDYAWVADQTGTSYGDSDVDSHLNVSGASSGQILSWNGTDYAWVADQTGSGSSYSDSDVDSHLNVSGASSGQILSWNGSDYAWVADQTGSGGGGSVTVGSTAPSSPSSGDLWYDTANAIFYLYVDDGNSQQWIETGRAGSGGGSFNNAVTNTYTGAQIGSIVTLTDAATIAMDASLSNNFQVTLSGNRTFGNPTNMTAGQVGSIFINQDGIGSRTLSWSSYWLFPSGNAPTLSTAGNSSDRVDYIIQSSTQIHAQFAGDFQ